MIYVVTAHRWGWLNAPMYHVWAGEDRAEAVKIAREEAVGRADKYGCQVLQCVEGDGAMRFEPVAYFPSAYAEKAPYCNPYIDMHESLGRLVRDAVLRGRVNLPDPGDPRFMTSVTVEVPEWLAVEVRRLLADAEKQDEIERHAPGTDS